MRNREKSADRANGGILLVNRKFNFHLQNISHVSNVPQMHHTVTPSPLPPHTQLKVHSVKPQEANPAVSASSACQRLSSAHDRIAKNQHYIIIYATQIRSSNMNSLAVTFVNNSLVNLWMTNSSELKANQMKKKKL